MNRYDNDRRPRSLFELGRLKYDAWRIEVESNDETRILDAQQRVADKQQAMAMAQLHGKLALADAEMAGRRRLLLAALEVEELEGEVAMRRRVRLATPERAREIVGAEVEIERLLLERDQYRRQRLTGPVPPSAPQLPAPMELPPSSPTGPLLLEAHISDQQIESLALRAVTRFGALEPAEAKRQWTRWEQELAGRFPPYAAQEIARRAEELRDLAG